MPEQPDDPRFAAVLDLLRRSGANEVQIRYQDDQEPTLWLVGAKWPAGYDCAGAVTPLGAGMRLLEQIMDGVGRCAHCGRPTAVSFNWQSPTPLDKALCWYLYDPETQKFRRSCEGETTGRAYGVNPETGETVGRNDPCPCGSGNKWKRCHGA